MLSSHFKNPRHLREFLIHNWSPSQENIVCWSQIFLHLIPVVEEVPPSRSVISWGWSVAIPLQVIPVQAVQWQTYLCCHTGLWNTTIGLPSVFESSLLLWNYSLKYLNLQVFTWLLLFVLLLFFFSAYLGTSVYVS